MYSKVSICKTCTRRVLDEQMTYKGHQSCIYCLVDYITEELEKQGKKKDDLMFALELLDHNYKEIVAIYEAAIHDNDRKSKEIHELRDEITTLKNNKNFMIDINKLIG